MAIVIEAKGGESKRKKKETLSPKIPKSTAAPPSVPDKGGEGGGGASSSSGGVQHGWWDDGGQFHPTNTKAEAVDAWRRYKGLSSGGVYDMGDGEIVDTRGISGGGQTAPPDTQAAAKGGETMAKVFADKARESLARKPGALGPDSRLASRVPGSALGPDSRLASRIPDTRPQDIRPPKVAAAQKAGEQQGRLRTGEALAGKESPFRMSIEELAAARLDLGYEGFEAEDARKRAQIRQQITGEFTLEDPLGISPLVRILENRGIAVPPGATPEDLRNILLQSAGDPNLQAISPTWISALESAGLIAPTSPFVDPNEGASGGYGSGGPRYRSSGYGGYRGTGRASASAATLGLINWRIGA